MTEKRVVELTIQELDATILALERIGAPLDRKQLIQYLNDETIVFDVRNAYRKMRSSVRDAKARRKVESSTDIQREKEDQSRAALLQRRLKSSYERNEELSFRLNKLMAAVRGAKESLEKGNVKDAQEELFTAEFECDDADE